MIRRIGKCSSCKAHAARNYSESRRETKDAGAFRREVTVYGRTVAGLFVKASDDHHCPACGAYAWNARKVEGFTTEHECDARCTDAKGFRCECSCGGRNHGRGLIVCEAA